MTEMPEEITVWRSGGGAYTRRELMEMDPVCLRALFRERVHHTIEVEIYPILLGRKQVPPAFGKQAELVLQVWKERGLPEDGDDFVWGGRYLEAAARLRRGEPVRFDEPLPEPFDASEMRVVRKLLWERRSVREWVPGRPVPDHLVEQILEAGRAAPTGCNLDVVRFVVIRDPAEARMVWSDIPTPTDACVLIVVCIDTRPYRTVGHDKLVPQNMLFDAAAAGDHMCLMAHALGLGAVWLSCTEQTAEKFRSQFGLPDHVKQALHLAVGWPAMGSVKSLRMPLREMLLERRKG